MQTVNFLIEKVEGGYTAYAQGFSILSEGDTLDEVHANAREGLAEQRDYMGEDTTDVEVTFSYDIAALFDMCKFINVSALAERLGMNNSLISQYISGKKTPSHKQKQRILNMLHQIGRELTQLTVS